MAIQPIRTDQAPAPSGAYSQALVVGPLCFTAGVGPADPVTGQVTGATIEEQTRQTLENLRAILAAANLTFSHVVKATVHLGDLARDFAGFDRVYRQYFAEPFPVRTTVGSTLSGILVEIDFVAVVERPS